MKKHWSTIVLVLLLVLGLGILLYPSVSDYYNSFHQSRAIASYSEAMHNIDPEDYTKEWEAAIAYNTELQTRENRYEPSPEDTERYNELLNITGSGIMGYIEIPTIKVSLPIYHSTDEAVLQIAIGHIEGTSLPTGGAGTHTVLSGHRGLPSAKLFSDLDQLLEGDIFIIRVLDEIMTYEVDQVLIVEPYDLSGLAIDENEDYCTLVTCTPYGINTHRMLVRGHRIENVSESRSITVVTDAKQMEPVLVAPFLSLPLFLILLIYMMISTGRRTRRLKAEKKARDVYDH